jgi:hypothetical protein
VGWQEVVMGPEGIAGARWGAYPSMDFDFSSHPAALRHLLPHLWKIVSGVVRIFQLHYPIPQVNTQPPA